MNKILVWQYDQLVKELLLLQDHLADPTCPCESGGEMCVRKHLFTIEAYAGESLSMEENEQIWPNSENWRARQRTAAIPKRSTLGASRRNPQPICWSGRATGGSSSRVTVFLWVMIKPTPPLARHE